MKQLFAALFYFWISTAAFAGEGASLVGSDTTKTGTIAATSQKVTLSVNGQCTVGIVVTGAWSGALAVKVAVDAFTNGLTNANYATTTVVPLLGTVPLSQITANGTYQVNVAGMSAIQVFGTNIASGTGAVISMVAGGGGCATIMQDNPFFLASQYPGNATAITGNATGTTGAVVGTLNASASTTAYICGFNVQSIGGTASSGPVTVAGLLGGSQVYQTDVNSATVGKQIASATFNPCIPASGVNTNITVTTTANGTATAVDVNSWGYRM